MDGRAALIRDLLALAAASTVVFALDVSSPPALVASMAYAGIAAFSLRMARIRVSLMFAGFASVLIGIGLALDGHLAFELSDALVSALLSTSLLWVVVLVGTSRAVGAEPTRVRFAEARNAANEAMLESHVNIVKLTEVQRALLDRLNLATQTAGLAIWDRDLLTGALYVDDSIAGMYGLRSCAPQDIDMRKMLHPDDVERYERMRRETLGNAKDLNVLTDRFRIVRENDGAVRHIQVHVRFFRNAQGKPERMLGISRDVTDEVSAGQALLDATEAAQGASRAKSALLANVSHEIRTPMNGIIGMTGLLLDGTLDASQRDYAETIRGSAHSLLRVIDDILDFSKIEAGRMEVESVPTEVRRTVEDVRALMSFQAAHKQLALRVEIDADLPARALTDPQRLRQCLVNLVGNAIKFTHAGSVVVAVKRVVQDGSESMRFEVRDTGIGVEADAMKRLFEPFVQADSSTTRNFGGTGLGLSIVKRLIEMMDGRVGVASTVGEGSTFWFDLPLTPVAEGEHDSQREVLSDVGAKGGMFEVQFKARILVVEDNIVNQKVARRVLERFGCEVEVADNGAEALKYHDHASFDLVLMDVQMPVMDGVTATRLIRQRELGRKRTPIVALTANAMNNEYERCMAAGMDGFLTKPMNMERLQALLSGFGLRAAEAQGADVLKLLESGASSDECERVLPIDLARLDTITDGDVEFTTQLLAAFFASAAESLEQMTQALHLDDRQQLGRIAHRLKGAAFNIHATAVGRSAAAIEQDAGTATREAVAISIEQLRSLVDDVAVFMQRGRPAGLREA